MSRILSGSKYSPKSKRRPQKRPVRKIAILLQEGSLRFRLGRRSTQILHVPICPTIQDKPESPGKARRGTEFCLLPRALAPGLPLKLRVFNQVIYTGYSGLGDIKRSRCIEEIYRVSWLSDFSGGELPGDYCDVTQGLHRETRRYLKRAI